MARTPSQFHSSSSAHTHRSCCTVSWLASILFFEFTLEAESYRPDQFLGDHSSLLKRFQTMALHFNNGEMVNFCISTISLPRITHSGKKSSSPHSSCIHLTNNSTAGLIFGNSLGPLLRKTKTKEKKFQYLKTLLKGDAAAPISGLEVTAECYSNAIDSFKNLGDNQRIVQDDLRRLRALLAVDSSEDVYNLLKLLDYGLCHIRGLKELNVSPPSYATMDDGKFVEGIANRHRRWLLQERSQPKVTTVYNIQCRLGTTTA
ncbi:hypothetical protein HPB51_016635 [Rhipicephalus microplus]|uniref:Uncharacterized protein n=1 Tax=Rhipicephalus microplus TaxID=6941 RepID=A0A9J6EHY7_RHIMP|nr:hypothetical protein HPB51_016635 [Rhipicephalus microplus]